MSSRNTRISEVAADIERRIREGEFAPHSHIPPQAALAEQYGAAEGTISAAVKLLARKGLVTSVRSYGTVVRDWRRPRQIRRKRAVYKDDRGYFFDHLAQDWQATAPASRIAWIAADDEVAEVLSVDSGSEVLIRERIVGDEIELAPGRRHVNPQQVSTTIVPADIARSLDLGRADTGPGGVLLRIEEAHGQLVCEDVTYARLPTKEEAAHLQLGAGDTPVLVTAVVMSDSTGRALVVNRYVMDARRYAIGHPLKRTSSAR